jgi:hypothetical protein
MNRRSLFRRILGLGAAAVAAKALPAAPQPERDYGRSPSQDMRSLVEQMRRAVEREPRARWLFPCNVCGELSGTESYDVFARLICCECSERLVEPCPLLRDLPFVEAPPGPHRYSLSLPDPVWRRI